MHAQLAPDADKNALWEEIQCLRKEVDRLQEDLNRSRRESDDYKKRHPERVGVKHGKAYEIKPEAAPASALPTSQADAATPADAGTPTKKKPGAQPGHKGHTRPKPERIDEEVQVKLEQCPNGAHHRLSPRVQETRQHTVEDARKEVQSIVTQYNIERRYCRDCKKLVETRVPGVLPGARVGLRAMLIVAWLRITLRLPQEAVPQVLLALTGVRISEGEVQCTLDQVAEAFGPFHASLVENLRKAAAKYGDESSWRTNGRNQYMWVIVTRWEAIFEVADSRSHKVPLRILGKEAKGTFMSDGHSAYNTLVRETKMDHARCWSHVLGDAKEVAEFRPEEGRDILEGLKAIYARAAQFEGKGSEADVAGLKDAMAALLVRGFASHKVASFARNTLKVADELLWFVTHPEVEGTNNRAERAIRPVVVARKISGGSRSDKGARVRSVLTSVFTTFKLRGIDPLTGAGLPGGPPSGPHPPSAG